MKYAVKIWGIGFRYFDTAEAAHNAAVEASRDGYIVQVFRLK